MLSAIEPVCFLSSHKAPEKRLTGLGNPAQSVGNVTATVMGKAGHAVQLQS
jgi:hypothetical protein